MSATPITDRYVAEFDGSRRRYDAARQVFPGGVTHDLRLLDPFPVFIEHASGCHKWDVDGHELIDYFNGHGALLLGHCPPDVTEAVRKQAGRATHPGACHDLEIEWGQLVQRLVPSAEKVRFTSSGTEATLMALRLCRMATGRPKVLKFAGHFHGWHDAVMPQAYHPYDATPVPGVPDGFAAHTVVIEPNDADHVRQVLTDDAAIGTVILEPTGGHWGRVPVRGEFLHALREITEELDRLLIFDEVITGFRVSPGGAQQHYGVTPDLTTLAKILAGGLPGGAVAGRADLLAAIEVRPNHAKMRHPGTFNGNPLSAAAGVTALKRVASGIPTAHANAKAAQLRHKLNAAFAQRRVNWVAYGDFSLVHLCPNYTGPAPDGDDFVPYDGSVGKLDAPKNPRLVHLFRQAMLIHGVDLPGMGMFLTACHTDDDIDKTAYAAVTSALWLRDVT